MEVIEARDVDVEDPDVGRNGAPGVAVVERGGHRLPLPQARSVGQQPPPSVAGHDLKPLEHVEELDLDAGVDVEVEVTDVWVLDDE
ncbi:MAG: hypothetical protein Q9227_006446 [Pyrenula ochraceoflavens]